MPHIVYIDRLWYCCGSGRIEMGYTPSHALMEWSKQ
jgi:hypothetical protein